MHQKQPPPKVTRSIRPEFDFCGAGLSFIGFFWAATTTRARAITNKPTAEILTAWIVVARADCATSQMGVITGTERRLARARLCALDMKRGSAAVLWPKS